jgi:hypothetical protein
MKGRKTRRNAFQGQFSGRLVEMMEAAAFRVLSLGARRVLDSLELEIAHHGGDNHNGKVVCPFETLVRTWNMNRNVIAAAFRETVALGFVVVTDQGRGGNREFRRPSKYRLTYRRTEYDQPTHEWRRFQSVEVAVAVAQAARQKRPSNGGLKFKNRYGNRTETGTETVPKIDALSVRKPYR